MSDQNRAKIHLKIAESLKIKKHLTNFPYMHVLEIIGRSKAPLSSYEIMLKKSQNRYVYDIIGNLLKPEDLGRRHPERFIKVSYNEKAQQKIRVIREKNGDIYNTELEVAEITNNPRNWRYTLNFKGFLLYLIAVHENKRTINYTTINIIIDNLKNKSDFAFLKYLDIFVAEQKINLLIQIAVELQYQLKTLTVEYLKYYVMNRCNDELSVLIALEDYPLFRQLKKTDDKFTIDLITCKLELLNELIPMEDETLKQRKNEQKELTKRID